MIGAEKRKIGLHIAKKRRPVTRSLASQKARGSKVENKSKVKGSMPVNPSNLKKKMCEHKRKHAVVLLFLFLKAITKDRTPIGVDLGRL